MKVAQSSPTLWQRSVFIPIPKKGSAKECSNYHKIAPISHTTKAQSWPTLRDPMDFSPPDTPSSRGMLKILQARLQQYVNREPAEVQAGFRKGRVTRDHIANICWIITKAREFQKNIYFCFIDYTKAFDVWITINCGKFWKRWEYQVTWPASRESCMQVRKQQLELDVEQQNGSK